MNKKPSVIIGNLFIILFYIAWIIFYVKLLIFEEISYYINPILNVFSWIMFLFMILVLIVSVKDLIKGHKLKISIKHFIFIIPILLLLIPKPQTLSGEFLGKNISEKTISNKTDKKNNNDLRVLEPPEENWVENATEDVLKNGLVSNNPNTKKLIQSEDFSFYLDELFINTESYVGEEFEITGLYYKDDKFFENHAFISRFLIVCCLAHAVTVGFVINIEDIKSSVQTIENNDWIYIKGKLSVGEISKGEAPIINVSEIKKIKEGDPYVFPEF